MTIKELMDKLQKIDRQDLEVCVCVTKTMSPYTGEPVSDVYCGFDWEQGKLMLCTKGKLIRLHDICKRCGMYGVKHAKDISSRVMYMDMKTGDMELAVYLGKKKMFSVPFNVKAELRESEVKQCPDCPKDRHQQIPCAGEMKGETK